MVLKVGSKTKRCHFCDHDNPKGAAVCELCGRGLAGKRDNLVKLIILGVLVAVFFLVVYTMRQVPLNITGTVHAPRLELMSSVGYHSMTGEMVVEGKVRNIGGDILKDVQAVVSWYDKQGNQLLNVSSTIYLNPLLSFQVSPFRVSLPYDAQMERYDISFATLKGEVIYTRDKRGKTEG